MAGHSVDMYAAYRETRHSHRGIAALILGLLSLILLIALVLWSASVDGGAAAAAGALGITAFLMSAVGLVIGLRSFNDRCRSYLFSKIGTVLSALVSAAWFLIVCIGLGA